MAGRIDLDAQGNYAVRLNTPRKYGRLSIDLKLNAQDQERVQKYAKKTAHLGPHHIHGGFLTIDGRANINFLDRHAIDILPSQPHTVALTAPPYALPSLYQPASSPILWSQEFHYSYQQMPPFSKSTLPIQIVPNIVVQHDRWGIELLVQTTPDFRVADLMTCKLLIKQLEVEFPMRWGDPDQIVPTAIFTPATEDNRMKLTWKNVALEEGAHGVRQAVLFFRLGNAQIDSVAAEQLNGRFEIESDHLLSGIKGLQLFYATGRKQMMGPVVNKKFLITADYRLALNSIRPACAYRPHIAPIPTKDIPDEQIICQLSDALSQGNIYVKKIIENPPRTNRANGQVLNRYWRLEGRRYAGIYPTDFHIEMTGKETYGGKDKPEAGEMVFQPYVHAMVVDDQMRKMADLVAANITSIIKDVLRRNERPPVNDDPPTGPNHPRLGQQAHPPAKQPMFQGD